MNSLTNNFRIDNDLHALLSEATNYIHERAHSGGRNRHRTQELY